MPSIKEYLELKIQSKTGINSAVIGGAIVTILACSIAMVFRWSSYSSGWRIDIPQWLLRLC